MTKKQPKEQSKASHSVFFYWILAGAALLYILLNPQYRTGVMNDDAVYVLGARSLWKSLPFHSLILKPDYPMPGLPMLLAPFIKLVQPHWTRLEWISIFAAVLSVYLFWKWACRIVSPEQALIAVSLFAFNPIVSMYSGVVMPPLFYTAAALSGFLLMSGLLQKVDMKKALVLGFILGWGSLVRPEGALLVVCVGVPLALQQNGRKNLLVAALPIALWGVLVMYWWRLHPVPRTEYGGDVSALTSFWTSNPIAGLRYFDDTVHAFIFKPLTGLWKSTTTDPTYFEDLLNLLCVAGIMVGYWSLWWKRKIPRSELTAIAVFCALYFLVHLFWHVAESRYAVPLLPFVFVFLVHGFSQFLKSRPRKWLWAGLALALPIVSYGYQTGLNLHESLFALNPMDLPPWKSLAWVNQNVPADVKIMSDIAPNIELYDNRPALMGILADNLDMFLYRLAQSRFDYVVDRNLNFLTPGVGKTEDPNRVWDRMRLWFASDPQRFPVVYENDVEQTRIFHVTPDPGFMKAYALYQEANAHYQAGRLPEAEELLNRALVLSPKFGSVYNLRGAIYMRKNDLRHAEGDFLQAVKLLPYFPSAMVNLATIYKITGQNELSQVYVQRALDAASVIGQTRRLTHKLQELYREWDQHRALIFIDAP